MLEQPDIESSTQDYRRRFSGPTGRWLLSLQEKGTLAAISGLDIETVLDVGGGHAQNVLPLLQLQKTITVLGRDSGCARLIADFLQEDKVAFDTGNLLKLPYAEDVFDLVISYRMLPHLNAWQRHIEELVRVSRRYILIDFPSRRSINYFATLFFGLKMKVEKNTRPYKLFGPHQVIRRFEQANCRLAYRFPQFFWPMVLHRALGVPMASRFLEGSARMLGLKHFFGSPLILLFQKNQPLSEE